MQHVLNTLVHQILPKYIKPSISSRSFYAVIVGGYDVIKCVSDSKRARPFLESLFSTDIDIDYVIRVTHDHPRFDQVVKDAQQTRDALLSNLMQDSDLKAVIASAFPGFKPDVRNVDGAGALKSVKRIFMTNGKDELVLLDTSLFSSKSVDHFRLLKDHKDPIPFKRIKQIPFATCDYLYQDTIRMLKYSFRGISSTQRKSCDLLEMQRKIKYFVDKAIKYILKYCALTVALTEQDPAPHLKLFETALKLYTSVQNNPNEEQYAKVIKQLKRLRSDPIIKPALAQ